MNRKVFTEDEVVANARIEFEALKNKLQRLHSKLTDITSIIDKIINEIDNAIDGYEFENFWEKEMHLLRTRLWSVRMIDEIFSGMGNLINE